jgi:hypothetical protein
VTRPRWFPALISLGPAGILIAPIGDRLERILMRYRKRDDRVDEVDLPVHLRSPSREERIPEGG